MLKAQDRVRNYLQKEKSKVVDDQTCTTLRQYTCREVLSVTVLSSGIWISVRLLDGDVEQVQHTQNTSRPNSDQRQTSPVKL